MKKIINNSDRIMLINKQQNQSIFLLFYRCYTVQPPKNVSLERVEK